MTPILYLNLLSGCLFIALVAMLTCIRRPFVGYLALVANVAYLASWLILIHGLK